MAEIQLRKFNMNEITHDKVVVLIGKRDTGKSFLCKDLYFIIKIYLSGKLYLELRRQTVFIVQLFLNYLYMENLKKKLLQIF